MFYGPIPEEEENRKLPQSQAEEPTISEVIKNLPPELREMIIKEYLAMKIRQRSAMGWNEVHYDLLWVTYCEKQERIV